MRQQLDQQEGDTDEVKETFSNLQQEVDAKTRKLKKLYALLQAQKDEITDVQEEHHRQQEELEETQAELIKTLKLKQLILESFVPPDEKSKVFDRAYFDEDEEEWKLKPLAKPESSQMMIKRPVSAVGNRRPVSEYARMAAALGGNPRYKTENVLLVELDMPNRTTRDYEGPTVAPRVQAALDAALQDEEELAIDASASSAIFLSQNRPKAKRNKKGKPVR